jgi:hypothetical protein
MCGVAARAAGAACGAGAARGAAAGCGAGAGCAAGGAPGGFAVAEVAAMPAARTRSAALRMLDCNMIPAPALSFRVTFPSQRRNRLVVARAPLPRVDCARAFDDQTFRIAAGQSEQIDTRLFRAGSRIWTASRLRSDSGISIKKLRGLPHPSRRMLRTFSECGRREFHRIISVPAPWSVRSSSSTACGSLPSRMTTPSTPASSA